MTLVRYWLFAMVLVVAAGISGTSPNAAEPLFDAAQKQELHKIIRDYLVSNPEVLREAFEALERQQQEQQLTQARESIKNNADLLYRSKRDFVVGNPAAKMTMVEFFDYNCGYCKRSLNDVVALVESDQDLKLVLKEFPILGPGSLFAARAAIAAKKQNKYWELHLAMMKSRGAVNEEQVIKIAGEVGLDIDQLRADMEDPEVNATINESMEIANALGINGTPAFVIDDRLIPGALGLDGLAAKIAEVRDGGGCTVC